MTNEEIKSLARSEAPIEQLSVNELVAAVVLAISDKEQANLKEIRQRKIKRSIPYATLSIAVCMGVGVFVHWEGAFKMAELCGAALVDCLLFGLIAE